MRKWIEREGGRGGKENGNERFSNTRNILHPDLDSKLVCGMTDVKNCILWQESSPGEHLLTTLKHLFLKRLMNDEFRFVGGERRESCSLETRLH